MITEVKTSFSGARGWRWASYNRRGCMGIEARTAGVPNTKGGE